MIQLVNISKNYKHQSLFSGVNLSFASGKKYIIKGINGSGKSVLLKIIVGFSKPTEGKVIVQGEELGKNSDFLPDSGVFINAPEFMGSWSGLENLLYLAKVKRVATESSIRKLAEKLDLEKDLEKKYRLYSLGMRQKMRIIQALMDDPKYLILDEPFDGLDRGSRAIVIQLLDDYLNENEERLLVYTSHMDSLDDFSDVQIELDNGQIQEV